MSSNFRKISFTLFCYAIFVSSIYPIEYELSLGSRYNKEKSLLFSTESESEEDKYFSYLLSADFYTPINKYADFTLGLYSGKLRIEDENGRSLTVNENSFSSEFKQSDFFINELFFSKEIGDILSYSIGKELVILGNGFIMGDYQYGLTSKVTFLPFFHINLDLSFIDFKSPLFGGGILFGNEDEDFVKIGATYFRDRNNSLASIITSSGSRQLLLSLLLSSKIPPSEIVSRIEEITGESANLDSDTPLIEVARDYLDLKDKSNQYWIYLASEKWIGSLLLEGILIYNFGASEFNYNHFDLESDIQTKELSTVDNSGYLYNIGSSYFFTSDLRATLNFLHSSGDNDLRSTPFSNDINSFISIYPYITHSNIFFSGGLDSLVSEKGLILSGVDGMGVISPRIALEFDNDTITGKAALVYLISEESNGSKDIGPEIDFEFSWRLFKHCEFLFEADFLFPKEFWGEEREDLIYNFIVGFDLIWGNADG